MNTIPYSLELWEEEYIEAQNGVPAHWEEHRVVFLGGDSMDYQGKAYDVRLTKDIYGELKLSFSIDGIFTSVLSQGLEKNYLIDYLFNEVKIKLFYDNQWYDFILKDLEETHNQTLTVKCNCNSLASCELEKIGYEIKFTLDDGTGSAVQDAHSFMRAILQDTEWNYLEAGTTEAVKDLKVDLTETNTEMAYLHEITEPTPIYDFHFEDGVLYKNQRPTLIATNGYLFIPYSGLNGQGDTFAFYTPTPTFEATDEYFISKDQIIIVSLPQKLNVTITEYTIEIPKKNIYSEYILYTDYSDSNNTLNQYCKKMNYIQNDETKTGYYREITRAPDYGYKKTKDIAPAYRYVVTQNTSQKNAIFDYAYPRSANEFTYYRFESPVNLHKNDTLDFFILNNKGMICYNGDWENLWESQTISDGTLNKIVGLKRYYYTQERGINGVAIYREWTELTTFEEGVVYYEAAFDEDEVLNQINGDSIFTINQFFAVDRDASGQVNSITILGYSSPENDYFYTEDENGLYIYNPITGEYYEGTGEQQYSRIYYNPIETYNMYRTIQAEKSNCFNLTQTVAETFEVWCRYIIEYDESGAIAFDPTTGQRKKWVTLTSSYGKVNEMGFIYGLNADAITRNIQTNELVTKLYVDYCENNVAEDGFISIQMAPDNMSREGYIFNFDYFIHKGLLNAKAVAMDLGNIETPNVGFDILTSESYIKGNKDAPGFLRHLGLLNTHYDFITSDLLGTGEQSLTTQLVKYQAQLEAYRVAIHTATGSISGSREEDKLKYAEYQNLVRDFQNKINDAYKQLAELTNRKKELIREFNIKYARFIYEGNWQDSSYISHEAYYADALKVSTDASKPNLSYTLDIANLAIAEGDGYELFKFEVGDETWVEDTEYFGYYADGRPYHEAVIVTEIVYDLENQLNTQITVANHSNKFEDLFQRLAATSQSYSINQQTYNRASNLTSTGALKYLSLQNSFDSNKQLTLIDNDLVTTDNYGLTVRNAANKDEIVRIVSGGIVLSEDGGDTYTTGITAHGINTSLLTAGQINAEHIRIAATGSAGAIVMENHIINMFTIDQKGIFTLTQDTVPNEDKIYYLRQSDGTYLSADTSRGFKTDDTGKILDYYEYSSSYLSQLQFSPNFGIRMSYAGEDRFVLTPAGELIATDLTIRGGEIELTDDGRIIEVTQILPQGSKILVSNQVRDEDTALLNANYGSYGLELWYNNLKDLSIYSSAIKDGAVMNMYSYGSEINLQTYREGASPSVDDALTIRPNEIIFSHWDNGALEQHFLNLDRVKEIRTVYARNIAPDGSVGKAGDIWIQHA